MMTDPIAAEPQPRTVPITASAATAPALVQAVLDRVIAALPPTQHNGASATLIGFRSVAPDLDSLLATTVEGAFGEAEAQGAAVVSAEVSGVMPVDEGLRCWGFVSAVPASGAPPMPQVIGSPAVTRQPGRLRATLIVTTGGEAA